MGDITEVERLFLAIVETPQVKLHWSYYINNRIFPENRYYRPTKLGLNALARQLNKILTRPDYTDPIVSVRRAGGYSWTVISETNRAMGKEILLPKEWRSVGDMLKPVYSMLEHLQRIKQELIS
jgi:hypothetical protein